MSALCSFNLANEVGDEVGIVVSPLPLFLPLQHFSVNCTVYRLILVCRFKFEVACTANCIVQ